MPTLHVVHDEFLHHLSLETQGESADWSNFYHLRRIKSYILAKLKLNEETPYVRPFDLPEMTAEELAEELIRLYGDPRNYILRTKAVLMIGRKRLGLKETTSYLRRLFRESSSNELKIELGFVLAQLAHLTLPTWTGESATLSFLWRLGWDTIHDIALNPAQILPGNTSQAQPIESKYTSGIYLDSKGILSLASIIKSDGWESINRIAQAKQIPAIELEPGLKQLQEAVFYASKQRYGLIEACGVIKEWDPH
jgi:hypothetical protein